MLRELPPSFYPDTQGDDEREQRIGEERAYFHRALDAISELCQRRQRQEPLSGAWVSKVEDVIRGLRFEVEALITATDEKEHRLSQFLKETPQAEAHQGGQS